LGRLLIKEMAAREEDGHSIQRSTLAYVLIADP
jgi:hypothetical protein